MCHGMGRRSWERVEGHVGVCEVCMVMTAFPPSKLSSCEVPG
jgi:hypothetical protein